MKVFLRGVISVLMTLVMISGIVSGLYVVINWLLVRWAS